MDLRIEIKDENNNVRYRGTVYQDGSDSEGLDRIASWLDHFFRMENTQEFSGDQLTLSITPDDPHQEIMRLREQASRALSILENDRYADRVKNACAELREALTK